MCMCVCLCRVFTARTLFRSTYTHIHTYTHHTDTHTHIHTSHRHAYTHTHIHTHTHTYTHRHTHLQRSTGVLEGETNAGGFLHRQAQRDERQELRARGRRGRSRHRQGLLVKGSSTRVTRKRKHAWFVQKEETFCEEETVSCEVFKGRASAKEARNEKMETDDRLKVDISPNGRLHRFGR